MYCYTAYAWARTQEVVIKITHAHWRQATPFCSISLSLIMLASGLERGVIMYNDLSNKTKHVGIVSDCTTTTTGTESGTW